MSPRRPAAALFAALLMALAARGALASGGGFDIKDFGRIPVLNNGRIKPLDTVARNSLLRLQGKQTLKADGRRISADEWLLELLAGKGKADSYGIFVINDPDVLGLIGRKQTSDRYFSFNDIGPSLGKVLEQADRAARMQPSTRSRFSRAVYDLGARLDLYQKLKNSFWGPDIPDPTAELGEFRRDLKGGLKGAAAMMMGAKGGHGSKDLASLKKVNAYFAKYAFLSESGYFKPVPPPAGGSAEDWTGIGESLLRGLRGAELPASLDSFAGIVSAYRRADAAAFNGLVEEQLRRAAGRAPAAVRKAEHEALFNRMQPFYRGMVLYLLAFLLVCFSWLGWEGRLRSASFWVLCAAFTIQSLGVISRMVLQGRPPVTNLYSSAVFVGWVAVAITVWLERINRRGIATAVGSLVGFCTLLIAHHLSMAGDTMEMMVAVLDSNFWLATHVITIIMGYGATFLAGGFAHVYVLLRLLRRLDKETGKTLNQMVYGTICFALLFTFVGTVLGGIWADQSWGRFWGWDPKENGALLMLLWQSVMLHARSGLYVREKGMMVMAVFGNIVTSLSWFGVNMLGIGLHSYGFMDQAFFWLAAFIAFQLLVMFLAVVPLQGSSKGG